MLFFNSLNVGIYDKKSFFGIFLKDSSSVYPDDDDDDDDDDDGDDDDDEDYFARKMSTSTSFYLKRLN